MASSLPKKREDQLASEEIVRAQDVVLRQEHKAGEKLFVDWAGDTIPIYDARGGPVQQAHLFVAVLGASSYTYAEVTPDEQLASWIGAHVRAFEFVPSGGCRIGLTCHQPWLCFSRKK